VVLSSLDELEETAKASCTAAGLGSLDGGVASAVRMVKSIVQVIVPRRDGRTRAYATWSPVGCA
jgi:hypothetical protein